MILAETYLLPYAEPLWWEWVMWYALYDPVVSMAFYVAVYGYTLWRMVDAYLTAFHRKSGHRLMYDGEPEEYRWRWPKE